MRRILIAATLLAAACGKRSLPATPQIKARATQAQQGISSASTSTQAMIGLQTIGSDLASAVVSGSVASVDLSTGLSDPGSVAATAMAPPPATNAATVPPGCLQRDAGQTPTFYPAGQAGCTATDHLEVTYDNGDKVNITWSESAASFVLNIAAVAGPWTGTSLAYSGTAVSSGASVTVTGAMKYSKAGNPVQVDAGFDLTYVVTGSQSDTSANVGISVNGTATDRIALVRANERWNLNLQTSTSGLTETASIDWTGAVDIDLLKADGNTTDHSVAFNLNLHVVSESSGSVTWSAAGGVDYGGAVVGNLITKNNQLYIRWTDAAEDAFDPAVLFGSFAV